MCEDLDHDNFMDCRKNTIRWILFKEQEMHLLRSIIEAVARVSCKDKQ
jgi:hypothetical protein